MSFLIERRDYENLKNKISLFFTGTTMDYCLLEDAFKENTGCKDNFGTERAKKHERKKLKRRAECFKPVDTEDRPAYEKPNSSISLQELSEAFTDVIPVNSPLIADINKKKATPNTTLPKHFLAYEDDGIEGFTSSFAPIDEKGFEKAAGPNEGVLPIPSVNDAWKPITDMLTTTSYFNSLPTPGGTYPVWNKRKQANSDSLVSVSGDVSGADVSGVDVSGTRNVDASGNNLQNKIDDLINRLNKLENEKRSTKNNQQEIIAFVGTGIFMIFALHVLKR